MSSRSFRRRNSRRRQRQQQEGGTPRGPSAGQGPPERRPGGEPPSAQPQRPRQDRSGGAGRESPSAPAAESRPEAPRVYPDCPLCGKPVRELASALTHRGSGRPAHFDCIMREIRDSTEMGPQERLCYLGGGAFGILESRPTGGPGGFVIKRRIQYEEKDPPAEWKKPLLLVH